MNNETHKRLVNDTEFIDHLALRSITWNELPDPIKLILCSNAVEMDCKHVWRLSIKLREVLIKEARHNGIEPQDCVLIALKEILGEHESFVGVLRSGSPPYDDGLFVDVIVNHDFGWSDTNLLVKNIVEEHPLVVECKFGMVVGEEQNNDELLIGGYGRTAPFLLNRLSTPNLTRNRLGLRKPNSTKNDVIRVGSVSKRDITSRSIRAVGRKKQVDTYSYDGLLILPDKVEQAAAAFWNEFQPKLVSLHEGKLYAA